MHFNQDKADHVLKFFKNLKHTKGKWKGVPFTLMDWQTESLSNIFGTLRDNGYRQYNTAYIEIPKKMGKALAVDTPIPTPDGWTTMGQLSVGDSVFDENGDVCKVINATDYMYGHECFEVVFTDGRSIIADAEHLWKTKSYETKRKQGKRLNPEDYIHTTQEIKDTLNVSWFAKKNLVCRNHAIEYHKGLKLPEKDLLIDPYLLGVWLGDGNSYNASITCAYSDYEILDNIKALGIPIKEWKTNNENTGQFGFTNGITLPPFNKERQNTINAKLNTLNLIKNKHIPEEYKRASYHQRLELLQGLMDTDGYIESNGQCEFTTIKERLANDVRDIINGLGIKANICKTKAKLNGKVISDKFRVQFYAYADMPIAKLERKRKRQKARPAKLTRNAYVQITDVIPVQSVPVKCIEVDSASKLYLAGEGYIPTHNSETAAGVALYCLTADGENAAEVYGCASDRQQASIVFDVAVDMVDQNPALKKNIKPVLSQRRLVYLPTRSFYQVLSAESYSKHGFNVHCVVFDELHSQPNRGLFDVMTEGSGDARTQPLYFIITTAGDDPDRSSIGWEIHSLAQDILTGDKVDPTFYSTIYGIDRDNKRIWTGREYQVVDEINWKDPKLWSKVNPSIDHTVDMEKVKDQFTRAQGNMSREKNFRWLRLNSWEKIKVSKWLGVDFWDLCKNKIDMERLKGRPCYGGLDLSSKIDMTSFILLFPPDDINKKWIVLPWFWLPEDNIAERVEKDNVPYDEWQQKGFLKTTPGNVIDYKFIEEFIIKLADVYDIQEIGYDPWNAMQSAIHLEDEGMTMVEVRQGYKSMSPPMKEIEQLTLGKKIVHNGHPILRWNIGNVEVKTDENENVRPVKNRSSERIDGLVAMVNAMSRASVNIDKDSIYQSRGLVVL